MHLYNDNEPFVCAWLRKLIDAGELSPGDVCADSINDLDPARLATYTQVHLFAGIGGWPLALKLAGWPDDLAVWTGSCPCQPFSCAGRGLGVNDPRHLWPVMLSHIAKCRPPVVFGEQVASAAGREWLTGVRADLEALGYVVGASDLCAAGEGAPHIRQRLYWGACDTKRYKQSGAQSRGGSSGRVGTGRQSISWNESWELALSRLRVMDDGLPRCVAATDAARNAIVPQVAATFIQAFVEAINDLILANTL